MAYCSKELGMKIMKANTCIGIFGVLAMFTGMLTAFSLFLFNGITNLLLFLFILSSAGTMVSAWLFSIWMNEAELERYAPEKEESTFPEITPVSAEVKKYIYLTENGKKVKKEIRGVYGQK